MNTSQKLIFAPFYLFHFSVIISSRIFGIFFDSIRLRLIQLLPFLAPSEASILWSKLNNAKSLKDWEDAAMALDQLNDHACWREDPISPYYDHELISSRLHHIRHVSSKKDIRSMTNLLRTGLIRNFGGLANPNLYTKSLVGTKILIEDYVTEVLKQLNWIADYKVSSINDKIEIPISKQSSVSIIPTSDQSELLTSPCMVSITNTISGDSLPVVLTPQAKYEYFAESLQIFGRTALILSGGMSFGLYHLGVVRALYEKSILPTVICGSSMGGSMVAALVCTIDPSKLESFFADPSENIDYSAFQKVGSRGSVKRKLVRFLKEGHLMNIKVVEEFAKSNIGDITFMEAYHLTQKVLNIVIQASGKKNEVPILLNYFTAPDVVIWSAACASFTSPGIYDPVCLMVKRANGELVPWSWKEIKWGLAWEEEELPFSRLSELFNVNHFIISKIVPFKLPLVDYFFPQIPVSSSASLITRICGFLLGELNHRLKQLSHLNLLPDVLKKFQRQIENVSQCSENVLTISPNIGIRDLPYIVSHPNQELTFQSILKGERATWPQLTNLEIRMKIEMGLIEILDRLKKNSPKLAPIYEMLLKGIEQESRQKMLSGSGLSPDKRKRTKSMY